MHYKLIATISLLMLATPEVAFAKSKGQIAGDALKAVGKEVAKNEAYQAARTKVINAAKREAKCKNTQGGNNANSTAAVRIC